MSLQWPHILRHIVLILVFLNMSVAGPSYYLTVPNAIIPGVNTTLAVHWLGQNHSEITVTAEILDNSNKLVTATSVFQKDTIGILTVPAVSLNSSSQLELVVNGSAQNTLLFSERTKVRLEQINFTVFVQTDKEVYKTGQVVKIRVISVGRDLKPHNGNVDLFITDPQNTIIQQWLKLPTDMGVASTEFLLSSNPRLGSWNIQAVNDKSVGAAVFSVNEYVLPKFDVKINAPSYYTETKKPNLSGTITAKYTYGKPVKGNVTVSISTFYIFEDSILVNKTYPISGSANFSFTNEEISRYGGIINITASVTEELTGIVMNTSTTVQILASEYSINMLSGSQAFVPGLNFTTKLQIVRFDGKALSEEERSKNISIKVTQSFDKYWYSYENFALREVAEVAEPVVANWTEPNRNFQEVKQYTIPESGIINIEFFVLETTQLISIMSEYENASFYQNFNNLYGMNSFAMIQTPDSDIKVGTPFLVEVETSPKAQELFYVVAAKGIIVATGKKTTPSFTLTPDYSWAPSATLNVYFLNMNVSNGEFVQGTKTLSIKEMFKNKVSLSWSKSKAEPAENVSLSLNVEESRALVGLRVVDKSALLLGDGNDLTASRVENEITAYTQRDDFLSLTDGMINLNNIYFTDIIPLYTTTAVGEQPSVRVRENFPETWKWIEVNISSGSNTNLQITVPDTITSWVASAFVISDNLGLGVTDGPVELEAFQNFFISLNMPYSVTRGEEFILEVILFNYLPGNIQVMVTLESSDSFEIIASNSSGTLPGQLNVTVPSQDGKVVLFPIKPKMLGEIPITVKATSPEASDAISQKLLVKAEGVTIYYSQAILLEANGSTTVPRSLSFTFPGDVVNGSENVYCTVIGDLLGPSINGLAALIQMPYGCGEQNMINFAPNIYVLVYLIITKQVTEDIRLNAIRNMETGYQTELTYMRSDGSFSAFGNNDPSGSTWLSAYVFKCFLQARPFIYISTDVLGNTVEWLVTNQDTKTGVFKEPGRVIHSELQGGLNGPISLTAYVLTALLEDEYYKNLYVSRVQTAVAYLENKFEEGIANNYTLSVVVYALSLANSAKANAALTQLNSRADKMGGVNYWSSPSETTNYWQPRSSDIETAAYALLSHYKQNRISEGIPIMKWLSQQRNHLGGYSSTQDTIMALQALSQFAVGTSSGDTDLTVSITGPGSFVPKTFQITTENLLVLQNHQIPVSRPLSLNVAASGKGLAIFQLNIVYNQKASSRRKRNALLSEAFNLGVTVKEAKNNTDRLSVDVCASYQGSAESGMVLLEVGFLSGFTLDPVGIPIDKSLKMVETKDDKVYLYFDSMDSNEICVSVPMVRVAKVAASQDAVVKISDYYNPRNTATRTYNSETMKKISTCDYCGTNCSLCRSNVPTPTKPPPSSANTPRIFFLWLCTLSIYYFL
ncbi:CD109 antigen-like [Discoglossus pictus]